MTPPLGPAAPLSRTARVARAPVALGALAVARFVRRPPTPDSARAVMVTVRARRERIAPIVQHQAPRRTRAREPEDTYARPAGRWSHTRT